MAGMTPEENEQSKINTKPQLSNPYLGIMLSKNMMFIGVFQGGEQQLPEEVKKQGKNGAVERI